MTQVQTGTPLHGLATAEFSALDGACYLNAASSGPLPARSRAALDAFNARRAAARLTQDDFEPALARARAAAAALVGGGADEIALTPNTSVGLNLAASFVLQRRREGDDRPTIVFSDREFPANVYPWFELERAGFDVEVVPCDHLGRPDEDRLIERIDRDDVALLALSAVQFSTGWSADLARFGDVCRRRGIFFALDAIQGTGVVPLDPRACGVDLLATGGQKWLLSPWGTGFAWVARERITRYRPLHTGWLAYAASNDFGTLVDYDRDLLDDARRFEVGSLPYPEFLAFAHALELLGEIGVPRIAAHVRALQQPLIEWASARPDVQCLHDPAHGSGIVCVHVPGADAAFAALQQAGVQCALREGVLRFAPHLYNGASDMERVIDALDSVVHA